MKSLVLNGPSTPLGPGPRGHHDAVVRRATWTFLFIALFLALGQVAQLFAR